jgi:hypothetical protein
MNRPSLKFILAQGRFESENKLEKIFDIAASALSENIRGRNVARPDSATTLG